MKNHLGNYYDNTQTLYNLLWPEDALHHGLWYSTTKNLAEAVRNTSRLVAELLEVNSSDIILDAGCGIGGTSRYIAGEYEARVHGITLSSRQLKIAISKTQEQNLDSLANFSLQDYNQTNFSDESFTKIFGIESICHAEDKAQFARESFRLLKKDGIIAIVDAFLAREPQTQHEIKKYSSFYKGWTIPPLLTENEYSMLFAAQGFREMKFEDKTVEVFPTANVMRGIALAAFPIIFPFSVFNILPRDLLLHTQACLAEKELLEKGIVKYGAFVACK